MYEILNVANYHHMIQKWTMTAAALELKQGYERAKNICLLSWIRYFSVLVPSLKSPWAECGAF